MTNSGYYRSPTIHQQTVVFVSEDDLWTVSVQGGIARRLTSNLGSITKAALSPDGMQLAFTGREEGHAEVYVMPANGGSIERLTYRGAGCHVINWTPDGKTIVFASSAGQAFSDMSYIYAIDSGGGVPQKIPTGIANSISFGPDNGVVIGRNMHEPAHWKRYRGGLTGDLWIDANGSGKFKRLIKLNGDLSCPLWINQRIFFISDHDGIGNIYSCSLEGKDLRQHTFHKDYYARKASSDGHTIVYQAGAELYQYVPGDNHSQKINIEYYSPKVQRNRKFVAASRYLHSFSLHPAGHSVGIICRGQAFSMANWENAVQHHYEPGNGRRRLVEWLKDGKHLAIISDAAGEETLEIHQAESVSEPEVLSQFDIGRPECLVVSPVKDQVALNNDRLELILIDIAEKKLRLLDKSQIGLIGKPSWSPDGRWIAYSYRINHQTSVIKICNIETGEHRQVTMPIRLDTSPHFEPDGNYLYFISYRNFDPIYDNMQFELSFPLGMRPYLITLRKDVPSPFTPVPRPPGEKSKDKNNSRSDSDNEDCAASKKTEKDDPKPGEKEHKKPIEIEFDGIQERVLAFPVADGRYGQIMGIPGKALFTSFPVRTTQESTSLSHNGAEKGQLQAYDFEEQKLEVLANEVSYFELSLDRKAVIYRSGNRLRIMKAGEKTEKLAIHGTTRKSGWINLNRIKVEIDPPTEWRQMYAEAWRLQRDHFWTENMSGIDWQAVFKRYEPLLERIASRSELSDLIWEMQGELGTSHAYEYGGDYRSEPRYSMGYLGADFVFQPTDKTFRLQQIIRGDTWKEKHYSPLAEPGLNINPGQQLVAINGRKLSAQEPPEALLVNQANNTVALTFADGDDCPLRTVNVKALADERPLRYRHWVEMNCEYVHKASDGKIGYIHIPDMGSRGFAEFHRGFLLELHRDALIVDIRYNNGGHVSELLLEKLARRRLGYDIARWGAPIPYPSESVAGPMLALINQNTCSDGDLFAHSFRALKLGPLVGTRTWGGVVGISPRFPLIDGTTTTQPEYSFWLEDVGWDIENYGVAPDVKVENKPQHVIRGQDTQLKKGVEMLLQMLEENPPLKPETIKRPGASMPKLSRKR
ncbi:PDZ domain-containing protein [candidate division KSB1 bacterium]|nr:PDZ domain-containing protein [candidate division KSB1 bacterium]